MSIILIAAMPFEWRPFEPGAEMLSGNDKHVEEVSLRCGYSTHSFRRTMAAGIYRKTSNLRAVQLLIGHTNVDSAVRYLGAELEDAFSIAERIDI